MIKAKDTKKGKTHSIFWFINNEHNIIISCSQFLPFFHVDKKGAFCRILIVAFRDLEGTSRIKAMQNPWVGLYLVNSMAQ